MSRKSMKVLFPLVTLWWVVMICFSIQFTHSFITGATIIYGAGALSFGLMSLGIWSPGYKGGE
jgi:hypothetical protein